MWLLIRTGTTITHSILQFMFLLDILGNFNFLNIMYYIK